jgi:hypothetical protein
MNEIEYRKMQRTERAKKNIMLALEIACLDIDKDKAEQLKKSYLLKAIWQNNKPIK